MGKSITIKLGSDMLPSSFKPCTYTHDTDYSYMISEDYENTLDEKQLEKLCDKYDDLYNHEVYKRFLFQQFKEQYESVLIDEISTRFPAITNLKVTGELNSPRYYNYETDRINFSVDVDVNELIKQIAFVDNKKLSEYLQKNFTSYDGFTSFTPNTVRGVVEMLGEDNNQSVAALMMFALSQSELELEIDREGDYRDFVNITEFNTFLSSLLGD